MRSMVGIVVAVLLIAAGSQVVLAQQGPGGGPGPMMQGGQGKQGTESFSDRKARVLKHIEERKAKLAEEKACVDKAQNDEDLMNCRPQHPQEGGMEHRGQMGGQGQRSPMGGPGGM